MKELINLVIEQFKNHKLILKLALYNMKSEYANHYLGIFWNIVQPLLQLVVYYLVFGLGLRGGGDKLVDGTPFILHLITGLFPWLFISQGINSGASAILSNKGLLSKMKFPPSVFLSISITKNIFNLIFTTLIIFIISLSNHLVPWWHYIYFFYFLISSIILIYSISLITSTLTLIIRDTKNLLQNIIRMLFFMTPIFWSIEEAHGILRKIVSLNPFSYLIEYYRLSFVHNNVPFYGNWIDHLYFWIFTLLILEIGTIIHYHFKSKLLDYI